MRRSGAPSRTAPTSGSSATSESPQYGQDGSTALSRFQLPSRPAIQAMSCHRSSAGLVILLGVLFRPTQ